MLYRTLLRPLLFRLPPETAHEAALGALRVALRGDGARRLAARRYLCAPFGTLERFGLDFANPVGLAAGFDKNGAAAPQLAALGFGFVEVGTVTHRPQPGNPRPRLFRLPADRALVNRLGFNNDGAARLAARLREARPSCVLGVNIGKSRAVGLEEAVADYLASFELVHAHADYVAVNVSSPNTPNLRELQRGDRLAALLDALQQRNRELAAREYESTAPRNGVATREYEDVTREDEEVTRNDEGATRDDGSATRRDENVRRKDGGAARDGGVSRRRGPLPLLVKIAPDLGEGELELIVDVARRAGAAGIIATNTTTSRDGLRAPSAEVAALGEGGLSGAPLRERSTACVAAVHRLARGSMHVVGVGGVFTAADAWEKICAGASLVQIYTGMIYEGVGVVRRINEGLAELVSRHGFRTLDEAVGCRAEELAAA